MFVTYENLFGYTMTICAIITLVVMIFHNQSKK